MVGTKAKIAGAIGWWRKMVRGDCMDCIMVDEQCVWTDAIVDAEKYKIPLIATNEKIMLGLPDRTNDPVDEIVDDLVNFRMPGVVVLDPVKAGEVGSRRRSPSSLSERP